MYGLKAQKFLAQSNGYKQHALKGQKLLAQGVWGKICETSAVCASPKSPVFFLSLRAYHFFRGLNQVNDCSKCHEIRNICTL